MKNLYACQEAAVRTKEQWIGFKLGKEALYCHFAYLTYMQSISDEIPSWMKHNLEPRFPGEISITSAMQMTESKEEPKSLLMNMKGKSEKASVQLNIQKMNTMASGPITSWQIGGKTMETVTEFILGGLQNHCRW